MSMKESEIYYRKQEGKIKEFLYKHKILKPKYKKLKGVRSINELKETK